MQRPIFASAFQAFSIEWDPPIPLKLKRPVTICPSCFCLEHNAVRSPLSTFWSLCSAFWSPRNACIVDTVHCILTAAQCILIKSRFLHSFLMITGAHSLRSLRLIDTLQITQRSCARMSPVAFLLSKAFGCHFQDNFVFQGKVKHDYVFYLS